MLFRRPLVLEDMTTSFEHYRVVEMNYNDRPARVLFSGTNMSAQSGIALDDNARLLFDYNERFMQIAMSVNPRRMLVLGGGTFTLPTALIATFDEMHVTAVERDPELAQLGRQYFGLPNSPRLEVVDGDAFKFIRETDQHYDMIVVDLFDRDKIPAAFMRPGVGRRLAELVGEDGLVAANIISGRTGEGAAVLVGVRDTLEVALPHVHVIPAGENWFGVGEQNMVVMAGKGALPKLT